MEILEGIHLKLKMVFMLLGIIRSFARIPWCHLASLKPISCSTHCKLGMTVLHLPSENVIVRMKSDNESICNTCTDIRDHYFHYLNFKWSEVTFGRPSEFLRFSLAVWFLGDFKSFFLIHQFFLLLYLKGLFITSYIFL